MYSLMRRLPLKRVLAEEVPLAGAAMIIAEMFFKFHSFTLECLAFLATWYAFDLLAYRLRALRHTRVPALLHHRDNGGDDSMRSSEPVRMAELDGRKRDDEVIV